MAGDWQLAERIVADRGQDRTLLELGCAVGFVTCLAGKVGYCVTATDYYQEACDFTRLNSYRNNLPIPITRLVDGLALPGRLLGRFEVVIASDGALNEKP